MNFSLLEARTAEIWSELGVPASDQEIMRRFLSAINNWHPKTYVHSLRVGICCYHLSIPDARVLCATGGSLHDVGKLKCDQVLLRNDITAEEYELMKPHARYGYELLKPYLPAQAMMAGGSHRRNGFGYGVPLEEMWANCSPETRQALPDQMLVEAMKILGVADCFEALHMHKENDRFTVQANGSFRVVDRFLSPRHTGDGRFKIDLNDPSMVSSIVASDQHIDPEEARRMVDILFAARDAERIYEESAK